MKYVELELKRNRGWPWDEDSGGRDPMFGEDGWCRSCGIPLVPQSGSLVLQTNGTSKAVGSWVPYRQYDAFCVDAELSTLITRNYSVEFRDVQWRSRTPRNPASQFIVPSSPAAWFDEAKLAEVLEARHGTAGNRCVACERWKWMPMDSGNLPVPVIRNPDCKG